MKRLFCVAVAVAFGLSMFHAAQASETIEIASPAAGESVEKVSTSKELSLVLPSRFFRAKEGAGFLTPYIAELYYTTDGGKEWKSYGLFKDLDQPFAFTAETEGRYGFYVVLVDQKGNHDDIPEEGTPAQVTVLVDWTPPAVVLEAPAGGTVAGGVAPLEIKWSATDVFLAPAPIAIEFTTDGGKTWQAISREIDNTGTYPWMLPAGLNARILIRVSAVDEAGHVGSAVTSSPVLVDTAPPVAAAVGPTLAASDSVLVDVRADDGDGSGIAELQLWTSLDNGATWSPANKSAPAQQIQFGASTGMHGLYLTAVDKAGNSSPPPKPGDAPQLLLLVDTKKPVVRLRTLIDGGSVSGGSQVPVQWEAVAPKAAERPVSIWLSPDGGNTWSVVATEIENSGCCVWDVPSINSSNCILKVTMKDESGTVSEAQSLKSFSIDSTRPTSAIGVPPGVMSQPVGNLGIVLAPMTGRAAETGEGPGGAAGAPPAPQAAEGGTPSAEKPSGETVMGQLAPTPEPSAPFVKPEERPFAIEIGPETTEEDVLKAAYAAYKAGQMANAKEYFQQAAKMNPSDARPHAALGRVYAREAGFSYSSHKESFEAALYEFDKALELGGDDADVYNDRGYVLLAAKRFKDAEKSFRKATQIGAKSIYWCNLGIALLRLNRRPEAAQALLKALEIEPAMKEANFYMGEVSAGQGNWEDAKKYYTKAVDAYGADSALGKVALAGAQRAREALGEVEPEQKGLTTQEKLDRIR